MKMNEDIKTHTKICCHSSKGYCALQTIDNYLIIFNIKRCLKIVGLENYLRSYLFNDLRVFTPTTIIFSKELVEIRFDLEGIEFIAERITVDEFKKEFNSPQIEGFKFYEEKED